MFVGGEFYYDNRWAADAPTISTDQMLFLNGGKACLTVICDYLTGHGLQKILLPSYLCPTIVQTVEASGLAFDFYQVKADLSIDLEDFSRKAAAYPAVYFINYFGFLHPATTLDRLRDLQRQGVLVVEDNAQAAFHDHPTGDFIFNSLRKFSAYDGGYLTTRLDVAPYLAQYAGRINHRLPIIRDYRKRLYAYLFNDADDYEALDREFYLAEQYYETDQVVLGDPQERASIERLDWPGIKRVRRENYQYLLGRIATIPEITPIFPALQPDNMPLGLPVYFTAVPGVTRDGVTRDGVNDELGNHEIGLTIHWEDLLADPHTNRNPLAVQMAQNMLTLPIDQRIGRQQLDYLVKHLKRAIRWAKRR